MTDIHEQEFPLREPSPLVLKFLEDTKAMEDAMRVLEGRDPR